MRERPLVWLAAALAAGIWLAGWVRPHPLLPLAVLWCALIMACRQARRAAVWLLLGALAAGAWRYATLRHAGPGPLGAWLDQPAELAGTARDVRADQAGWRAYLHVEAVRAPGAAWAPATGRVWVSWRAPAGPPAPAALPGEGERVAVHGVPAAPAGPRRPDEFDFGEYLARRGVFLTLTPPESPQALGAGREPWLSRAARQSRERLESAPRALLDPAQAALLSGLVLGSKDGIPVEWQTAFRVTGVYHILAASGANVALVVLPLLWLLARLGLGRRQRALVALPAVGAYCLLAGAGPPVTRAALMAGLALAGEALDRPADAFNSLAGAAAVILLAAPGQLYDLGFQLSFAATLGILNLARPIQGALDRVFLRPVATGLAVTAAAMAAVEPLLWATFGYVVPASPLANLLVALPLAVLVPLGLATMLIGAVWAPVAGLLLPICGFLLEWLVRPIQWLALAPGAYLPLGPLPQTWALAWYGALVLLRWWPLWRTSGRALAGAAMAGWRSGGRRWAVAVGACLSAVALALGGAAWTPPERNPTPGLSLTVAPGEEAELHLPAGGLVPVQPGRTPPPGIAAVRPGLWRAEYDGTAFLLAGSLDSRAQRVLAGNSEALRGSVLLAPAAPLPEFLAAVHAQIVVFQKPPPPGALRELRRQGARVLRTDRHGRVEVVTDGRRLHALTARHSWPEAAGHWFGAW